MLNPASLIHTVYDSTLQRATTHLNSIAKSPSYSFATAKARGMPNSLANIALDENMVHDFFCVTVMALSLVLVLVLVLD